MGRSEKRRRSGFRRVLSQYGVLQSIADAYDLRILHAEKRGRVFRVNTSQGWKKIKEFKYSQADLAYVHGVLEHLAGKGWRRTTPLHLTRDGLPYVETPEGLFYMTAWIQGEEINSEDPFHLEMAAKILGEMHRLLQDYKAPENCQRSFPAHWQDRYTGQAEDLERYRQLAEGARKGKFGRRFWKVADDFIRLMGIGLQLLNEAGYQQLSQVSELVTVCHTSPTAGNLIVGSDGKIYIIDFDNCRTDLRIYDLGKMILRHSGWDVDKAVFIIRSYQEANPLTREEISLLPGLCAFPTKGWQVARSFFEEGKVHMGRLEKAISELARQEAFVNALAQIAPEDLCYQPEQLFQTVPYPDSTPEEGDGELDSPMVSDVDEPEMVEAGVDIGCDGEAMLLHQHMPGHLGYVPQPFYWGYEYPDFEQLEAEELRKLVERLGQLTERLEAISQGAPQNTGGGDEGTDDGRFPKGELVVVETGIADQDQPAVFVAVEQGQDPSSMEEDIEVVETVGFSDLHAQEESEVRVDLAADMEHVSRKIPEEPIQPGMEIPVEYAAGLEPSGEQEVVFHHQEALETVEAAAEGLVNEGTPLEEVVMEGMECTLAEPLHELVEPTASQDVGREEEVPQQSTWEEEVTVDDPPMEVVAAPQEEIAEEEEEIICPSEELGLEVAAEVDEVAEVDEAAEIMGEGLVVDDSEPEQVSSASMDTPQSKPVVEWSSFPEPMHRRRRNRGRPV